MQNHLTVRFVIFTLIILIIISIVNEAHVFIVLADSPYLDHQEIPMGSKEWTQVDSPLNNAKIRDGRTIYFKTATDISECEIIKSLPKLTSMTSVSDGDILNTTFWLSKPHLNYTFSRYPPFVNETQIHQQYLDIQILPSGNKTLDEYKNSSLIINSLIRQGFTNVSSVKPNSTNLDSHDAYQFVIDRRTEPKFGNLDVKAIEVISIINKKLYKIVYVANTAEYSDFLRTFNQIIGSFKVLNSKVNANSTLSNPSIYKEFNQIYHLRTYTNPELGIEIKFPSNWEILNKPNSVTFFSPINGPYLLRHEYSIGIDIPTGYYSGIDFMARIVWDDNRFNQTWTKVIEERSSVAKKGRIQDLQTNYQASFEKGSPYVLLPVDLRILNSPQEYSTIFGTDIRFIQDGRLCELADLTNTIPNPPPILSILPSLNSSTLGPNEVKTLEVKIETSSKIRTHVDLNRISTNLVEASFSPPEVNISPLGWATTKLTIKGKFNEPWSRSTSTETLPIVAKIRFPQAVEYNTFGANTSISGPGIEGQIQNLGLPVTVFNAYDYILHTLNSLSAPINVYFGVITGIIGGFGSWLLKESKDKKNLGKDTQAMHHNQSVSISDEISKLAKLKEEGILTEEEFKQMKQDLIRKNR